MIHKAKLYLLGIVLLSITASMNSCKSSGKVKLLKEDTHKEDVLSFQKEMNESYKAETSPLTEEDKAVFEEHDFFPINPKYQVLADFRRTPEEKPFAMPTTTDRSPIYVKFGEATFNLGKDEFTLSLYRNTQMSRNPLYKYSLFLPFTDLTNGNNSYGGGRYIDATIPKGDKILIDFNKAYNPYCCYNDKYSCPIPPRENFLDAEIRAGIKFNYD